jgi:hypothetical protein
MKLWPKLMMAPATSHQVTLPSQQDDFLVFGIFLDFLEIKYV